MSQDRLAAIAAYKRLHEDQKRAFCHGDLELSDILVDELTEKARHLIVLWLTRWGEEHGVLE
jgi:hypothetical protein